MVSVLVVNAPSVRTHWLRFSFLQSLPLLCSKSSGRERLPHVCECSQTSSYYTPRTLLFSFSLNPFHTPTVTSSPGRLFPPCTSSHYLAHRLLPLNHRLHFGVQPWHTNGALAVARHCQCAPSRRKGGLARPPRSRGRSRTRGRCHQAHPLG